MEEEIIYEIVDSIVNNQDKIIELTQKIECPTEDEVYQKEISYKNNLNKNIKNIKKLEKQKKINENNFKKFATNLNTKLKQIEDEISKINNQLNELENNNNDTQFYKKSYEKLKNAILNKKNEENLKILNDEYNNVNILYNDLSAHIMNNEIKKEKLNEFDLMMEEEKDKVDMKIIEYMSLKESCEEIAKLQLKKFILDNLNFNTNNYNNSNTQRNKLIKDKNGLKTTLDEKEKIKLSQIKDVKIFFYEMNFIDINKLGNEIGKQIVYLINTYITSFQKNQINDNSLNNLLLNKSSAFQKISKSILLLDDNNNNNTSINNLNLLTNNSKIYNKSDIKSLISILSTKMIKHMINFMASQKNYIENENYISNFDPLFKTLNELILSFIYIYYSSYFKTNVIESSNLILFIKYFIKAFYYENIIVSELFFLNEKYPNDKQIINNNISLIDNKNNKLNSKKDEYLLSKNQLEEKIKILNQEINDNYNNLTEEEMLYVKLNQKLNDLIEEKQQIKYDFIDNENDNKFKNEKIDNKIENLKNNNILLHKNILTCQEEIKLKNKQNKIEIEKLNKSIKEKFNIIKNQLGVYKKKHGDNMDLYNKFVDRINETLKATSKTSCNTSDDNTLMNTQSTYYKSNEKRNLRKNIFTPEKIKLNTYYIKYN
jgi:hypothetical protein